MGGFFLILEIRTIASGNIYILFVDLDKKTCELPNKPILTWHSLLYSTTERKNIWFRFVSCYRFHRKFNLQFYRNFSLTLYCTNDVSWLWIISHRVMEFSYWMSVRNCEVSPPAVSSFYYVLRQRSKHKQPIQTTSISVLKLGNREAI